MTRIGYDAVNYQAIPSDAQFVLGYVDGVQSQWPAAAWAHFNALGIPFARICVNPDTDADVLDCEPGNPVDPSINPGAAVAWAARQANPCIYCSAENVPKMVAAFQAAKAPLPMFNVCTDSGVPVAYTYPGVTVICTQWQIGNNVDNDLVAAYWPGIDPAPAPPAPPAPPSEETDMNCASDSNGRAGLSWIQGGVKVVQGIYDGATGPAPDLRVVVLFPTGPLVATGVFNAQGQWVYQVPNYAQAYGIITEAQAGAAPYFLVGIAP